MSADQASDASLEIATAQVTPTEAVVIAGARSLAGRRRVFAGIGLPTLAVSLAQRTVAPEIELIYESGVCGAHPTRLAHSVGDSFLVSGAEAVITMSALFGYVVQGGYVDVGFLGAAQIDRHGNLNSTVLGSYGHPSVRLPGPGGACEIMANAAEVFVIMRRHELRSFVDRLDFCTSPSPVSGAPDSRGLGVTTVVSNLGILKRIDGELVLTGIHPGVTVDEVRAATGWPLKVADDAQTMPPPSRDELDMLRTTLDPLRVYLR